MESNDSPEIPDRGEASDIPSLLSGEEDQRQIVSNLVLQTYSAL